MSVAVSQMVGEAKTGVVYFLHRLQDRGGRVFGSPWPGEAACSLLLSLLIA